MASPIPFQTLVKLELDEAPTWLSHIEITQDGDMITLEVVRVNGSSCGISRLTADDFNNMADVLLRNVGSKG